MSVRDWLMPPAPAVPDEANPEHHVVYYGTQIVGCGPLELFDDITRAKAHYLHHIEANGVERTTRLGFDTKQRWELSPEQIEKYHVMDQCDLVIRVWCARVVKEAQTS